MRALALIAALLALPAEAAELIVCGPAASVSHREGAPTDTVVLTNWSEGPWSVASASIDLGPSAGRLVFDTAPDGAGINVSQPFRVAGGVAVLADMPVIPDGAETMTLSFTRFGPGEGFTFTIDLDDRVGGWGGTTIETAETADARFSVTFLHADGETETHEGLFDATGRAVAAAPCLS